MNIYELRFYDDLVNKTFINIFTLSKDKDGIYLSNFNQNNKNHKYFLQVARNVSTITGKQIYLNMTLIQFLKFKLTTRSKDISRTTNKNGIDIDNVLLFISDSLEIDNSIFGKIYEKYWEIKK